jgi:hypothetical protein
MFAGSFRLAKRPIQQLASDLFGLDNSLGMIPTAPFSSMARLLNGDLGEEVSDETLFPRSLVADH